ncbi:MAG TPA: ABC transporter permease [Firmicutes bacterium]|nr:ABC transporter permease [Bacillota bacterium]
MGILTRFSLRRERVGIPVWIISIIGVSVAVALAFPAIYPPGPERDVVAETLQNPAMISMIGPAYGIRNYHMGAVMAHQMLLFTAVAVAIMNILLGVRHTRNDEELGRTELIRSLPVGGLSSAGVALLMLALTNLALTLGLAVGLGMLGLEGMDWNGSILYGAAVGACGMFFAAATVLIAQLTETARGALGFSFAFLALSYLLRAVGDVGTELLSLVSPLGLVLRAQIYVNNYWWPISILLGVSIFLIYLAFLLNAGRDVGAGLIAARPGRTKASFYLRGPLGLALRLQGAALIGWAVGMFVLGAVYGSVFADIDAFFQTSDIFELLLPSIEGFSLTEQFTATLLAVMTMIGLIPVLLAVLKLRSEERRNRTEHLLALPVSRKSLMGSHIALAVFTSLVMQLLTVLGLWLAASMVMTEPLDFAWLLRGAAAYLPVYWVMIGLAAVLVGFIPKVAGLIWLHLGYTFFVVYLGGLLRVPAWMVKLTVFGYVPDVPLEPMGALRTAILLLAAACFIFLGLLGYGRRDVHG